MNHVKVLFLFIGITLFSSCFESTPNISKFRPNLEGFETKIDIVRFDKIIFGLDTNNLSEASAKIQQNFPSFFEQYLNQILGTSISNPLKEKVLSGYINYPASKYTFDTISQVFQSVNDLSEQLMQLHACASYYGISNVSSIDTAILLLSEFSFDRAISDQYYLIPLDMALGTDFSPTSNLVFPFTSVLV